MLTHLPKQKNQPSATGELAQERDPSQERSATPDLRGLTLEEQEQKLAPQPEGEAFEALKPKPLPPRPSKPHPSLAKNKRTKPRRRSPPRPSKPHPKLVRTPKALAARRKRLSAEKRSSQEAPTSTPTPAPAEVVAKPEAAPTAVDETAAKNAELAGKLERGANAVGMIIAGVDKAGERYEAKRKARAEEVQRVKEANASRSLWNKLRGKGKQRLPPEVPPQDAAGAKADLSYAKKMLTGDAAHVRSAKKPAPPALLPASAGAVEGAADRIEPKTEQPLVESTRDLGVGLREGDDAMLSRMLARGGELATSTIKVDKKIAQNKEANVYKSRYLGIAPVAYKVSHAHDYISEAEDPSLLEHATMREIGGAKNSLRAGGRTTDKSRRGFVMELAQKGDLRGVQKATAELPLKDRMEIWRHLIRGGFRGLDRVHDAGLVHGDVKNENMLLGNDLEPKMMDYGTTKREGETASTGTAAYMSPEVGRRGDATKASDVWSMGESLLMGVFGMNSVDMAKGGHEESKTRFGEETSKEAKLKDKSWLAVVEAKVKGQAGADVFMDFIKKVMAMDPADRLTSKSALKHEFLAIKRNDEGKKLVKGNKGKEKLREVLLG